MINPILSNGDIVDHCQEGEDGFLQYVTLRDYFAVVALQGISVGEKEGWFARDKAEYSYEIADAMLSERAKPK